MKNKRTICQTLSENTQSQLKLWCLWQQSEDWKEKTESWQVGKVAKVQIMMGLLSHIEYFGFVASALMGFKLVGKLILSMHPLAHFFIREFGE